MWLALLFLNAVPCFAVATDIHGTPLHISILRGNRADSTTLRSTIKILRRRFQIPEAVFVFDGGMSSKINLQSLEDEGLEALLKDLPSETQLELTDAHSTKPDAQKIASQAGRTLQQLKAHKSFTCRVDDAGILQWERKQDTIAAATAWAETA